MKVKLINMKKVIKQIMEEATISNKGMTREELDPCKTLILKVKMTMRKDRMINSLF